MNTSSEYVHLLGPLDSSRIDQLVAGDLSEDGRRSLLVRLDSEPDGWRRCALAFLEVQTWREAFAPLGVAASADRPAPAPIKHASRSMAGRRLAHWSIIAACVAIAFALGWAVKPVPAPVDAPDHARMIVAEASASAEMPLTDVIAPPVEQAKTTEQGEASALLESVVASYERQGYLAERQKKLINVKLEDGREHQIQAQEVRLRFVGDRIY
jgi:hypothetical protein